MPEQTSANCTTPPTGPAWLSPRIYAKYWRLHFYAGFILAPLIIWLCVTGILYVVGPQVEVWMYRDYLNVNSQGEQASFDAQVAAAQAAYPYMMPTQFHPSEKAGQSAYVVMTSHTEAHSTHMRHSGPTDDVEVYINPYTAEVIGSLRVEEKYARQMMDLHGTLYIGDVGRLLTELGTVWSLVLVLTGLYLWIPQKWGKVWGVWVPRIQQWKGRIWWRDFHSVGGMYMTGIMLAFLTTALMITYASGTIFALSKVFTKQMPPAIPKGLKSVPIEGQGRISIQSLKEIAADKNMLDSYMITLPVDSTGFFKISADNGMGKPEARHDLSVDQYSGKIVFENSWDKYPIMTKLTIWGLSFHFGVLWGAVTQILGILACLGLIFFTVSGVVMWWKRRPANAWALPKTVPGGLKPFPKGLIAFMVVLCILQPTLGVSLLIGLGVDWLVIKYIKWRNHHKPSASVSAQV